ncbi:MAG: hypothetical protein R8K54_01660 [Mariprofundaceae bacterium]
MHLTDRLDAIDSAVQPINSFASKLHWQAEVPEMPIKPKRAIIVFIALLGGAGAGNVCSSLC